MNHFNALFIFGEKCFLIHIATDIPESVK